MHKPKLLDLFCGAGGAAMGYHQAGFEVVGVDIRKQPRFPFEFIQADAMTFPLDGFDVIHASPPCQGYSPHVSSSGSKWAGTKGVEEPRLIAGIRERLAGVPYVIENVMGARSELNATLLLCGTMFGLPIPRHRLFELEGGLLIQPFHPRCSGVAKRYAEERGWDPRDMTVTGKGRHAGTSKRWAEITGIDWMSQHEMRESIPPVYTEHIGKWIMRHVMTAKSCGAEITGCTTPIASAKDTSGNALNVRNGGIQVMEAIAPMAASHE